LLITFAACGPEQLAKVNPALTWSPQALDFGERPVLDDLTLDVDLANLGGAPLEFSRTAVQGDDAFVLKEPVSTLNRGESATLKVTFTARAKKAYSGKLVLDSNDPEHPHVEIALAGVGSTAATAVIEPRALDFGRVGENRAAVRRLRITSTGTADLKVKAISLAGGTSPAYGFIGSVRTPQTLGAHRDGRADEYAEVTVKFAPTSAQDGMAGTLVLETTDPENALVNVPLTAGINLQPLAVPGGDRIVAPATRVVLDGSRSSDPDGDLPLTFSWKLVQTPQASQAALLDLRTPAPSITPDLPGSYVVELVVTDAAGLESKPARAKVNAVTSDKLVVELVWNHPLADLDLHFLEENTPLDGSRDATGERPDPDFGLQGYPDDDPHHSADKLAGFGPEWVVYEKPADGRYQVIVKYVSANGSADLAVPATVRVHEYGVVVAERQFAFSQPGETWEACRVEWPSGVVTGGMP